MAALSRYWPQEAAAIMARAEQLAAARAWPSYMLPAVPALFNLADDRLEAPTRGAWLAALSALWIAEVTEEPAPGWLELGGVIGDAANVALQAEYTDRNAPSAFEAAWRSALAAGEKVLEVAAETGQAIGSRLSVGAGLGAVLLGGLALAVLLGKK